MTRAEREKRAVAEHRCPKCKSQKNFRCCKMRGRVEYMGHPHAERVALVSEDKP